MARAGLASNRTEPPYFYHVDEITTVRFDFDDSDSIASIFVVSGAIKFDEVLAGNAGNNTSDPAQAREFGIFFGSAASQFDLCVQRGYIASGPRSAENTANSVLETMQQFNNDPEGIRNAREGWLSVKQSISAHPPELSQAYCDAVAQQWAKYAAMMQAR